MSFDQSNTQKIWTLKDFESNPSESLFYHLFYKKFDNQILKTSDVIIEYLDPEDQENSKVFVDKNTQIKLFIEKRYSKLYTCGDVKSLILYRTPPRGNIY